MSPVQLPNGVQLLTREDLALVPPRYRVTFSSPFGSTVHWEGPAMGVFPHESCAAKWRGIQRFHMAPPPGGRGWSDIAYNFGFCPHGYVLEGRGFGIKSGANGTTAGNSSAHAVCYLSGQGDPFTDPAALACRTILDEIDACCAGPGRNCHRDWKPTACPGDVICSWVHAGQPIPDHPDPPEEPVEPVIITATDSSAWLWAGGPLISLDPEGLAYHRNQELVEWGGYPVSQLGKFRRDAPGGVLLRSGEDLGAKDREALAAVISAGVEAGVRKALAERDGGLG